MISTESSSHPEPAPTKRLASDLYFDIASAIRSKCAQKCQEGLRAADIPGGDLYSDIASVITAKRAPKCQEKLRAADISDGDLYSDIASVITARRAPDVSSSIKPLTSQAVISVPISLQ